MCVRVCVPPYWRKTPPKWCKYASVLFLWILYRPDIFSVQQKLWNLHWFKRTKTGHFSSGVTVSPPISRLQGDEPCSVSLPWFLTMWPSSWSLTVTLFPVGTAAVWFHQVQSHNPLHLLPSFVPQHHLFMFDIPALTFMSGKRHWSNDDDDDDDDGCINWSHSILFLLVFCFGLDGWFVHFLTKTLEQEPSCGLALPW